MFMYLIVLLGISIVSADYIQENLFPAGHNCEGVVAVQTTFTHIGCSPSGYSNSNNVVCVNETAGTLNNYGWAWFPDTTCANEPYWSPIPLPGFGCVHEFESIWDKQTICVTGDFIAPSGAANKFTYPDDVTCDPVGHVGKVVSTPVDICTKSSNTLSTMTKCGSNTVTQDIWYNSDCNGTPDVSDEVLGALGCNSSSGYDLVFECDASSSTVQEQRHHLRHE